MNNTYIDNYEKNLIENAVNKTVNDIALKLKKSGVDSKIIFEATGLKV